MTPPAAAFVPDAEFVVLRNIAEIPRSSKSVIRVNLATIAGRPYVDVRCFSRSRAGNGEYVPQRQGIAVPAAQLKALGEAIADAGDAAALEFAIPSDGRAWSRSQR